MLRMLVVLGKNWKKYPKAGDTNIELSTDSKISALAAGLLLSKDEPDYDYVIFSTGKTAGANWPSEAKAMKDYLLSKMTVSQEKIILEEISIDTAGNAEEVGKLLSKINDAKTFDLMTVGYHLPRAVKIFTTFLPFAVAHMIDSYSVLFDSNQCYCQALAKERMESFGVKIEKIKEFILRRLLIFDPYGRCLRKFTLRVRHQK